MMYNGKVRIKITEGFVPEHVHLEAEHDLTGCEIHYAEHETKDGKQPMLSLKLYIKAPARAWDAAIDDTSYVCDHQRAKPGPGPRLCHLCALEALDEATKRLKIAENR